MNEPLAALLSRDSAEVLAWESTELDRLLATTGNRIVLFGAGNLGLRGLRELRSIGVEPLCFSDNDASRWGTFVEGCTILSPAEAATRFGADALFLVSIWNAAHWFIETRAQLLQLGCTHVCTFSPLFWRFSEAFLPDLLNDLPSRVFAAQQQVLAAEALWRDPASLETYRALVRWYATGDASRMPARPPLNTYFPMDLFTLTPEDVLVDCGAFDGDTILLIPNYATRLPSFHAIEADPLSLAKLDSRITSLPAAVRNKVHIHRCAVGAERGKVRFETTGGVDSKIASEGGVEVDLMQLDELFATTRITMLKMDIEGAETDALLGARSIIQRDQPILAICVYHRQCDLWGLPLLVHELLPQHTLHLRSYEGDGFQTVLYAIPQGRQPQGTSNGYLSAAIPTPAPDPPARSQSFAQRLTGMFPPGQLLRYLCVGAFNTLFSYLSFAVALTLLNRSLPQRYLYLTVVAASLLVTPLNITVSFLGYKFIVFRTRGRFLREWLRCFAVYGAGTLPGLFALSAITRILQTLLHANASRLHDWLSKLEAHLGSRSLLWVQHVATGKALAGYLAGALIVFFATAYSFTAHKHITFKRPAETPLATSV